MENAQKIKGVCLSQAHTFLKTDFISELSKAACKERYGIVVFNCSMDDYWEQTGNNITGRIYELMRCDQLAVINFFLVWIRRVGALVALIGGIMFGLAVKANDPDQKERGILTMVAGFIVFAIALGANMFDLFT